MADRPIPDGAIYQPHTRLLVDSGRIVAAEEDLSTVGYIPVSDGAILHFDGLSAFSVHHALGFYDVYKRYVGGISFPMMTADELFADHYLADVNGNVFFVDLGRVMAHYVAEGTPIHYVRGTFSGVTPSSVLTVNEGTLEQGGWYDGRRSGRAFGGVGGTLGIQCLSPG